MAFLFKYLNWDTYSRSSCFKSWNAPRSITLIWFSSKCLQFQKHKYILRQENKSFPTSHVIKVVFTDAIVKHLIRDYENSRPKSTLSWSQTASWLKIASWLPDLITILFKNFCNHNAQKDVGLGTDCYILSPLLLAFVIEKWLTPYSQ